MPAVKGFFPCHSKTGSGRPEPRVKGGFAAYLPLMEGGGFGPAGRKAVGGLTGNPPLIQSPRPRQLRTRDVGVKRFLYREVLYNNLSLVG